MNKSIKFCLVGLITFIAVSCAKKEDALINQTFALPLGSKELKITNWQDLGAVSQASAADYWYNGRPYKAYNHFDFFLMYKTVDFSLDSTQKINWIKKIDLKIKAENAYPTVSYFQIYLQNEANLIIDSVFTQGPQLIEPGKIDQDNDISEPFITIVTPEPSFEGSRLEHLKAAKTLLYKSYIKTKREDNSTAYFSVDNKLSLNLALRLYLEYSSNEL